MRDCRLIRQGGGRRQASQQGASCTKASRALPVAARFRCRPRQRGNRRSPGFPACLKTRRPIAKCKPAGLAAGPLENVHARQHVAKYHRVSSRFSRPRHHIDRPRFQWGATLRDTTRVSALGVASMLRRPCRSTFRSGTDARGWFRFRTWCRRPCSVLLVQEIFKTGELLLPETPLLLDPVAGEPQGVVLKTTVIRPALFPAFNQAGRLQHIKMLGDRRGRDGEGCAQFGHRTRPPCQPRHNLPPCRIRESGEDGAQFHRFRMTRQWRYTPGSRGDSTMSVFKLAAAARNSDFSCSGIASLSSAATVCRAKISHSSSVIPRPSWEVFMSRPR